MLLIPREGRIKAEELAAAFEILGTEKRKLYLIGEIGPDANNAFGTMNAMADIEYLSLKDPTRPIILEVSSPGGEISFGLGLIDKMEASPCEILTIGSVLTASMAAVILACGEPGKRFIYPHCRVMIHLPAGQFKGDAKDMQIYTDQMEKTKQKLAKILSEKCGKPEEEVLKDMDRDFWMTAEEAKNYGEKGLVDHIIEPGTLVTNLYPEEETY